MSTSFDTVRNEQIVAIRALTPTSLAGSPFVASLGEHDFRTWAQATGKDSLRRFDIEDVFSDSAPEVSGHDVLYRPRQCDVLVAYPHDYRYGAQNRRSLDRVIREDMSAIDYVIGAWGTGNYTDACAQLQSVSVETYEAVSILVIRYMLHFSEVF